MTAWTQTQSVSIGQQRGAGALAKVDQLNLCFVNRSAQLAAKPVGRRLDWSELLHAAMLSPRCGGLVQIGLVPTRHIGERGSRWASPLSIARHGRLIECAPAHIDGSGTHMSAAFSDID